MSLSYGRYLLACVWMKTLFSVSAVGNPYVPEAEDGAEKAEEALLDRIRQIVDEGME